MRVGLAPDGDVPATGWGALDSFYMAVSWAFPPPLPGPSDFILQRFSKKIIHTILHMLLSHQHRHPTQT